jgi:nicotinamide mononucleotide transporter
MQISGWATMFLKEVQGTPVLEWIAIVFAVAEVFLAKSNKVQLYPAGIISTAIYTWLFVRPGTKLYADAMLNSYYLIMSIYGWVLWGRRAADQHQLRVSYCTKKDWIVVGLFVSLGWWVLYFLLTRGFVAMFPWYTPSDVALVDAFVSATAWAGMWLLAKRKIENWLLLNVSNLIAIPLYVYKGMPFTAALTLFLFIVAIFGYLEWRKIYNTTAIA